MSTPTGFIQTHTHAEGHSTEAQAARKAGASVTSTKKRILARLEDEPDGITPDEFCDETGGLINTIRRRFTDLWKEGKICHHPEGKTRMNGHNNECVLWVLGEDTARKPSRYEENKGKESELRAAAIALYESMEDTKMFIPLSTWKRFATSIGRTV